MLAIHRGYVIEPVYKRNDLVVRKILCVLFEAPV
jgi:hypothetical protein